MGNNPAIVVDHLSKLYYIGKGRARPDTLRDLIVAGIKTPIRRLSSIGRSSGKARENGHGYETIWALKDVSLEIKSGEVVGLIGRNGAGKSTFLKLLSRITEPTGGKAIVYGRVGSLLEVGTGFHPELTGRENIYLNGAILGMTRAEIRRKFDEIVAFAEIEKFLDMPVKRYSSGMYVRLAFAVAAHLEPEILLVDEVLAVGDANFQKKCLGKMDDVAKGGRTILFVSHNMNAIQRLCPKSILLESGKLKKYDDTHEVVKYYLSDSNSNGADSPGSWIDLRYLARGGTREAIFSAFRYSSLTEAAGYQPFVNGPLEVMLEVDSNETRSIGSLAVTIYDQYGTKLVNADTLALGRIIKLKKGKNVIRVLIHKLALNPGFYVLGLWLANPSGDLFDYLTSAARIEVVDIETERLGSRPRADGLIPCDFDVVEVE